jgi:nucleotide-binding universal stress UspA family protein
MEEYREYGEKVVRDVVSRASQRGLDGTGSIRTGKISEDIVEYGEEKGIDHIVMSGQGRGAIEKYLGSTAEKVLRLSSVPVTVVGSNSD